MATLCGGFSVWKCSVGVWSRRVLFCGWAGLGGAAPSAARAAFLPGSPVVVDYVVHISVDGLRGDLLKQLLASDPASYPSFQRLRAESSHTFNARCDYTISETVPNHVTMVTGRPVHRPAGQPTTIHHGYTNNSPPSTDVIHGFNVNVPYVASVFDVVHDRGRSTALLLSKAKLALIERSYDVVHGAADLLPPDQGRDKIEFSQAADGDTGGLLTSLTGRLASNPDAYTFMHLHQPDEAGHIYGWGSAPWNAAVAAVDVRLAQLFAAVDARPALRGRLAIVLTADHGGGGGGAASGHSDATRIENVTIPFFVWAQGFPPGAEIHTLLANRWDPGATRPDYNAARQPLRNGDSGNLSLALLGLGPVPGSWLQPAFVSAQSGPELHRVAGQLEVRWGVDFAGYVLETSAGLSPESWQLIDQGITAEEGGFKYLVPVESAPAARRFFRLRKP